MKRNLTEKVHYGRRYWELNEISLSILKIFIANPPPQMFCMLHKPKILQSRHIVELKCFIESLYAHITIGFTVQLVSD